MEGFRNCTSARERIIKAYLKLLAQGDRKKITVSDVVRIAECNRDTFYYYFSSLDDAARCTLDELAPTSIPRIAVALAEGDALLIPEQARTRMLLVAKISRSHPKIRCYLEEMLKNLWIRELSINTTSMNASDMAVLDFMAAGTVGFICEHLASTKDASELNTAFGTIARTFGKSALDYVKERNLIRI